MLWLVEWSGLHVCSFVWVLILSVRRSLYSWVRAAGRDIAMYTILVIVASSFSSQLLYESDYNCLLSLSAGSRLDRSRNMHDKSHHRSTTTSFQQRLPNRRVSAFDLSHENPSSAHNNVSGYEIPRQSRSNERAYQRPTCVQFFQQSTSKFLECLY